MNNEAIVVNRLTKAFGKSMAVDHISFTIPKGSVVGFLGPNGAGKSTTIKMLLGLLRPSTGGSSLLGHDSQNIPPPLWARIGYVPEDSRIYDWMEVKFFVDYTSSFYPNWDYAYANELMQKLELPPNKKLRTLSRGQRGKVFLLLALAYKPELLILDDPVSGLDPIVRREFLEQIIELLQHEGRTVLFSSHILDEVERIADHILVLNQGKLLANQSLDSLKTSMKRVKMSFDSEAPKVSLPDALTVKQNGHFVSATFRSLSHERISELKHYRPKQFETEDLNLSEIFVELVKGNKNL